MVGHAVTFPEALRVVQSRRPDIVIWDLQMPGGRGTEVLKTIKKGQVSPIVNVLRTIPTRSTGRNAWRMVHTLTVRYAVVGQPRIG